MLLSLAMLGPLQVTWDDHAVTFPTAVTRALLAYLAVEADRSHSRESLASLFWPDQPQTNAYVNLRQTLARLRHALGDESNHRLEITSQTLRLCSDGVTSDIARWDALLADTRVHPHADLLQCPACLHRLEQAAALYRGEFLQGLFINQSQAFEEWLLFKREQWHLQALDVLDTLMRAADLRGDDTVVRHYAQRQLMLEPWRESAHAHLMRALVRLNQRTAALAQYETCRRVLAEELGIEPSVELQALYQRIRDDTVAPATLTTPLPRHNLPTHLTPFVGREQELADLAALLDQPATRLVTLVGVGGMGKTRLAVEAARRRVDAYPDGVYFVALAPLTTVDAIAPAIANAIGLELSRRDPHQAVLQALRAKQVLLVLDNFEHLIEGAKIAVDVLQTAPQVQIVVTSREQLTLHGEAVYRVQGIDYAAGEDEAIASPAVQLFEQVARRVDATFAVNQSNLPLVYRICQLVQGMPLGIELAAAWVEMLPLDQIVAEIEQSLDFLHYDWRDAPERQHSLRAVFDWSWRLLTAAEQQTLRQLSVFRGGFTRDAAQAILGVSLRGLSSLVHKSLLRLGQGPKGAARYEIHELVRQFAAEQLDSVPDESAQVAARHGEYYLSFLAARETRLARDEPREAAAELASEIDNVRQAWTWAVRHSRLHELDRAGYGMWLFYHQGGLALEAEQGLALATASIQSRLQGRLDQGLDGRTSQRVLSKLLALYGSVLISRGRHEQALAAAEQAMSLAHSCVGLEGEALGALVKGQALRRMGQWVAARSQLEDTVRLAHEHQGRNEFSEILPDVERLAYNWLCSIALSMDDYSGAEHYVTQGLIICRSRKKRMGEWFCLTDLGDIAEARGDYQGAREHFEAAFQLARHLGFRRGEAITQYHLGEIARQQGHLSLAQELIQQALEQYQAVGDPFGEAYSARSLGRLYTLLGNYELAEHWLDHHFQVARATSMGSLELFPGLLYLARLALLTGKPERALMHAEEASGLSAKMDSRLARGQSLVVLGHVQASLGLSAAQATYEEALAAFGALPLAAEARAGLAALAQDEGQTGVALAHVAAILELLAGHRRLGQDEPFSIYLTCYRVLQASGDPRAWDVLRIAHEQLREQADHLADPVVREQFLDGVLVHRQLERAWADREAHAVEGGLVEGAMA